MWTCTRDSKIMTFWNAPRSSDDRKSLRDIAYLLPPLPPRHCRWWRKEEGRVTLLCRRDCHMEFKVGVDASQSQASNWRQWWPAANDSDSDGKTKGLHNRSLTSKLQIDIAPKLIAHYEGNLNSSGYFNFRGRTTSSLEWCKKTPSIPV